jgi:hypothetical protein
MDVVLKDLVGTQSWVIIDDVIIFSRSVQEHSQTLENLLQILDKATLKQHPGKCVFAQPQVNYLVFVLSEKGVSASSDKIKAVRNCPTPKNAKDFRAYLGLASFFEG